MSGLLVHLAALTATAPPLPVISDTFTVHTREYDQSGSMIAHQTIARDSERKRQYMIADGKLAHGHLEEATRCDISLMGYMLSMHGAEGSSPSSWKCINHSIASDRCTFSYFWELPTNATWAGQVQFNETLAANRFVWYEAGESYESLATLDGHIPLRIGRTAAIAPHRRYHIDWIGFSATVPPVSAFVPPVGLRACTPSTDAEHAVGLGLQKVRRSAIALLDQV